MKKNIEYTLRFECGGKEPVVVKCTRNGVLGLVKSMSAARYSLKSVDMGPGLFLDTIATIQELEDYLATARSVSDARLRLLNEQENELFALKQTKS